MAKLFSPGMVQAQAVKRAHLVRTLRWVEAHVKEIKKINSKISVKKFWKKKISTKIFRKSLFLAIFGQKFDKSSELAELDRPRDASNSAQWPQYNPIEMNGRFYEKLVTKNRKI